METSSLCVRNADPYVKSPVSAYALERHLVALLDHASPDAAVRLHRHTGLFTLASQEDDRDLTSLLPLRLGALCLALDAVARGDSWLLPRSPVFYTDPAGKVHIDFPGLAGFTVDAAGLILARAVNPY